MFPVILAIGGKLVVRSNWDVYCAEMVKSVQAVVDAALLPDLSCHTNQCTWSSIDTTAADGAVATHSAGKRVATHFQNKYLKAGVPVYEASFDLGERTKDERCRMLDGIANPTNS